MNASVDATIVITTKDRKDDLRTALQSAVNQTASVEVLVIDDGSTDGTAAMVQSEFPSVRLHREERSAGLIVRRNQAARLATGSILFSIDDDAEFTSPHVVAQTLEEFAHPDVGAVAIPYVDVRKSPEVKQQAPDDNAIYCTALFRGTAHALRRKLFLKLGGYRDALVHQGEEMDYCIRMLDAGAVVRLGSSDVIYHYESPRRDFERWDYYGARNTVFFEWRYPPAHHLPIRLLGTIANTIRTMANNGRMVHLARGLFDGLTACFSGHIERNPVRPDTYELFRVLKKTSATKMADVQPLLPNHNRSHLA